MKKLAVVVATFFMLAGAYGAQTNNGCQGNCPTDTGGTVNEGGTGGTAYGGYGGIGIGGVGIGGNGGAGGQGGSGGSGGNASATGGGGGSVVGSGNSSNRNDLSQGQGQSQSNKQGQSQSSKNDNRSSATNTNSNSSSGNSSNTQVGGDTYVSSYRAATSTAFAPSIAPTAVCMGSSSAGASGMSFSVSLGSSWTDGNCMLLEQVRTVAVVLADKETASAMMCTVDAYRIAREKGGKPCQ